MAFYSYLSTKIIIAFITKSYQDLFGVRSYINALYLSTVPKNKIYSFKPLTSNGIFLPFIINDVIREGNEVYFTFLHGYISFSSFNWK